MLKYALEHDGFLEDHTIKLNISIAVPKLQVVLSLNKLQSIRFYEDDDFNTN